MMHALRPIFAFLLATIIGLGSVTHALARHQAQGAETLVICTGYGLVQITIDADGNKVEQTLPCPDCLLTGLGLLPETGVLDGQATFGLLVQMSSALRLHSFTRGLWPRSRAPPVPV
ncbi:MAG: hypothetical protein EA407_07645 [Rhodobacteraceae bacterium]|nr:MAG: hypothetical protein EA407_07645 [Paracoccaceae bacterium]